MSVRPENERQYDTNGDIWECVFHFTLDVGIGGLTQTIILFYLLSLITLIHIRLDGMCAGQCQLYAMNKCS